MKNIWRILLAFSLSLYFPQISLCQNTESPQQKNLTVEELQQKYPDAEIKQVPYDQLEAVKNSGYYDECSTGLGYDNNKTSTEKTSKGTADLNERGPYIDFNNFINFKGGSDKNFLILVAVVGVVVVAFLVVYSVGYLYQAGTSSLKCLTWKDFGWRSSFFDDRNKTQYRSGFMHGLYFSTGYRIPLGVMGLTGEIGQHSLDLTINKSASPSLKASVSSFYKGTYIMVGPSFSLPLTTLNGHLFQIELLAGTSTNENIGLMSTLRFGLNFRIDSQLNIGINAGAALIDIKNFSSYLKDSDQLNSLLGTSVSFKW
jgi:hypothetical protein